MSKPIAIDTQYLQKTLIKLLNTPSPSGMTEEGIQLCLKHFEELGLDCVRTRRGALRAKWAGQDAALPARGIIAHVDTLGAQIKNLKDNGRVGLAMVGHWSARFAEGARCTIHTDTQTYRGTILPLKASGHTFNTEIDTQPSNWQNLEVRIDADLSSKDDLMQAGINVGDMVSVDATPEVVNGYINARHLDDKAGVASMLAAVKALKNAGHTPMADTYFMVSVYEEVGAGAPAILPDDVGSLVSIDNGTTAPGQNSAEHGVTIAMGDMTGPFDRPLTQKLINLCNAHNIQHQRDVFRFYKSDNSTALAAGHDIQAALITFGIDASHGWERIHLNALESVAHLTAQYVCSDGDL